MPVSWNFDPVIRNWIIVSFILFFIFDFHIIAITLLTQIWWSEFDEDRAGFDLEEYVEHHLDEFGHFDTWAGDVYKAAEKYGDVRENYAKSQQTRHTMFRRLYKEKDDEEIKEFDYAYWEDNYNEIENKIKNRMREGLKKEKEMYNNYKEDVKDETEAERSKRARHTYEQFLSARVGEKRFSADREDDGNIDALDIDESGAELEYIYYLSEKMFDWVHSTAYEEKDSSMTDIQELWTQYVLSALDKRTWKLNFTKTYIKSKRRDILTSSNLNFDYQKELKIQPYPMFASWLPNPFGIPFKRQRNKMDFYLVNDLFSASQPEKVDLIKETQYNIVLADQIRKERYERALAQAAVKKAAWDKAYKAYQLSFNTAKEKPTISRTSLKTDFTPKKKKWKNLKPI